MYVLGQRSLKRLEGVHPDLARIVKKAIQLTKVDFMVLEGRRTRRRQAYLVKKGASKTMNSRHISGHAVDLGALVKGKVSWDWKYYYSISDAMKSAAKELGIPVEWGGDWHTFKDAPHWQLPRSLYK